MDLTVGRQYAMPQDHLRQSSAWWSEVVGVVDNGNKRENASSLIS